MSNSSSPARSAPARSRSASPRTKRMSRAQEERDLGRGKSRDNGTNRDRERDRDREKDRDRGRDRNREREREKDAHRVRSSDRSRDRDHGRDRIGSRGEEGPRNKRGREREIERSRDRSRDRRGGRERPVETSPPIRSPVRLHRDRSISPKDSQKRRRRSPSRSRSPLPRHTNRHEQRTSTAAAARNENGDDASRERARVEESPQQDDAVARMKEVEASLEKTEINKEKPSFEYSGKLAAETNKVKGVILQFTEPPEARKPTTRWRLYVFKDGEPLNDPLYIHRQTCYLFGRERRVADIPTDHPSCSKQHAVIQYRFTEKEEGDGMVSSKVRPYVMDLGSTNGTMLNGERLDPQRYYEMFEKDTIKFGNSSREYVLLHEHSIG